jgi:hypothetical protein
MSRRMGALNALDELLPGPDQVRGEAAPQPSGRVRGARRSGAFNVLDDLLPGPEHSRPEPAPVPLRMDRIQPDEDERGGPVAAAPATGRGLGAGSSFDAFLKGAPPARPNPRRTAARNARVRTTFCVSKDLLKAMRDAVGQISATEGKVSLDELAERALQAELNKLTRKRRRTPKT